MSIGPLVNGTLEERLACIGMLSWMSASGESQERLFGICRPDTKVVVFMVQHTVFERCRQCVSSEIRLLVIC